MTLESGNDAFAALIDPATLRIERRLPGPISRVWDHLTRNELRAKWLAAGDMELRPGADVTFTWRNDDLSASPAERPENFPEVMTMDSRIIEARAPVRLVFTWGDNGDVTIDLAQVGEEVVLTLVHRRIADDRQRLLTAAGWHMHLDILRAELAGETPPSFWSGWLVLREVYAERLAA